MTRNPVEAVLGFGVLAFACIFLFVDVRTVEGYPLRASFSKVGGLEMGADVRINGIKVGSVTKIDLNTKTHMADIELTIKEAIKLPKDTVASIVDSGIMGDKYVRLEPGKAAEALAAKDVLTNTKSYRSLEDNVREFIFLSTKDDAAS